MGHNKRQSLEVEIAMSLGFYESCIITAQCDGYYDPGQSTGPIETSYPPEGDFEASDIKIIDEETGTVIDFNSLSKSIQERIETRLEEEFFNYHD